MAGNPVVALAVHDHGDGPLRNRIGHEVVSIPVRAGGCCESRSRIAREGDEEVTGLDETRVDAGPGDFGASGIGGIHRGGHFGVGPQCSSHFRNDL